MVGGDRPDQGDERQQSDRRERGERHVVAAVDGDDVVRTERGRKPCASVEERVGEVEEVATAGVEEAIAQPIDDRRREGDGETDPHRASASPRLRRGSVAAWPTTKVTMSVT